MSHAYRLGLATSYVATVDSAVLMPGRSSCTCKDDGQHVTAQKNTQLGYPAAGFHTTGSGDREGWQRPTLFTTVRLTASMACVRSPIVSGDRGRSPTASRARMLGELV